MNISLGFSSYTCVFSEQGTPSNSEHIFSNIEWPLLTYFTVSVFM